MHCTKSQALVIQTMINVNCSCKIFLHKGRQVWKPTSLRARTEIDASTAWRNLGEKGQNANLHKKDVRRPILTTFGTSSLICLPVLPTLHRTHLHTLSCLLLLKTPKREKKVEENLLSARMVLLELNNSDCEDALLHVLRLVCRLVDHQVST